MGQYNANIFCGNSVKSKRKKKEAKKKEIMACGNDASMEIRKKRGFPQRLGKAFGFPTFPQALLRGYRKNLIQMTEAGIHLKQAVFLS